MTNSMSLVLPTDHASSDLWGSILNTALGLVTEHDHTTGKGVQIPSAALKVNADVAWAFGGTSYAITGAKAFDLAPTAASTITGYSSALFANATDSNNLYYRNSAGQNVQITSGSTINVSVVGGIGGDYASVGALLSFDDATDSYWLQQQGSPRPWARVRVGDVDIYETAASVSNRVRLKSPSALAASYALTFPPALVAGAIMQFDGSGVGSFSNSVTGNLTSSAVVQGTDLKWTTVQNELVPASAATTVVATGPTFNGTQWLLGTTTGILTFPVQVRTGDTITYFTVFARKTSASGTITAQLHKYNMSTGVDTTIGAAATNSANNPGYINLSIAGLTETPVGNGFSYFVSVNGGGVTGDEIEGMAFGKART